MKYLIVAIASLCTSLIIGQDVEIAIANPSFEDMPHRGTPESPGIKGWYDCGQLRFRSETPPDIHPIDAWEVTMGPSEGDTYLGMVVRDNDSWESVAQRLELPVEDGKCYAFNIDLARSAYYMSGSKKTKTLQNYTEPAVLRIWGGTGVCGQQELLGESVTVANNEWRTYEFKFEPNRTVNYITLEAFYKTPSLFPYNGHLLVDNASLITEIPCDDDIIIATESTLENEKMAERPKTPATTAPTPVAEQLVEEEIVEVNPEVEPEIISPTKTQTIPGLNKDSYKQNEIIRINSIVFAMDKATINEDSQEALDEVYEFMKRNKDIVIEIGGHTSTGPGAKYCDDLSSRRAKEVAKALVKKGVSSKRLYYKGYGKRKPIVLNDSHDMEARRKNQRVEIKILQT